MASANGTFVGPEAPLALRQLQLNVSQPWRKLRRADHWIRRWQRRSAEDRFGGKLRGCLEGFHGISIFFLLFFNEIAIFWIGFKYISMRCSWNCEWNCHVFVLNKYIYIFICLGMFMGFVWDITMN